MSYTGIDTQSSAALQQLQDNFDFSEVGNGDAIFQHLQVTFQSASNVENTITDMWLSRTTHEFGKIRFEERPSANFDTDNIHIEFDANWSNVTYSWDNDVFQIEGSSPRFGDYSVRVIF